MVPAVEVALVNDDVPRSNPANVVELFPKRWTVIVPPVCVNFTACDGEATPIAAETFTAPPSVINVPPGATIMQSSWSSPTLRMPPLIRKVPDTLMPAFWGFTARFGLSIHNAELVAMVGEVVVNNT